MSGPLNRLARRLTSWWNKRAAKSAAATLNPTPIAAEAPHTTSTEPLSSPAFPSVAEPAVTAPVHVPPVRVTDGKRSMWLWTEDGRVHLSLTSVARATERRLSPADVAVLLLADPSRTRPAIQAVTGIDDAGEAIAQLRRWLPRTAVRLDAASGAGRRAPDAPPKPTRPNIDGTVRTVSGGLPSLGKRRR